MSLGQIRRFYRSQDSSIGDRKRDEIEGEVSCPKSLYKGLGRALESQSKFAILFLYKLYKVSIKSSVKDIFVVNVKMEKEKKSIVRRIKRKDTKVKAEKKKSTDS